MNALEDFLTRAVARALRRPLQRWLVRGAMLVLGAAVQLWLTWLGAGPLMQVLAWTALAFGVLLPRTSAPLIAGLTVVMEAAVVTPQPVEAVPVALGLAGWHLCAVMLTTGRPWARLGAGARRAMGMPALIGLAGVIVAMPPALLAGGLVLPEVAAISMLLVLGVVLGAAVALWPAPGEGQSARR
ncbi:hypothetical protein [Microbacterium invictum]|uniref:Uncharacterized protein n=1 Tax=Microbacterium invictum TaxID=515415 RepID=A0AA40SMT2_9MICO|nr:MULTISPECIES: hypothetical protein [Microbacterium]MBB4139087.1 hypothetical protein [Microbacterium invictum]